MKCLGYENERFDVMGWSDGANSAVLLASLFPSSVRKLVLFGGNAYFTPQGFSFFFLFLSFSFFFLFLFF